MRYSAERREAILKKMLPPNNKSVVELAKEEGISEATLYKWRKEARRAGRFLPASASTQQSWSSKDKFAAVMETASMNASELAAYCRKRGLYVEQIESWRQVCEQANAWSLEEEKKAREASRQEKKRSKELERELARKEKALAEMAALMTLRKKAQAIWGDEEE